MILHRETVLLTEVNDTTTTPWKRRYYEQLERFEHEEERWRHSEEVLRRTLLRLSLAADGLDAELDKQLQALRSHIRRGIDSHGLENLLENMSESLVRLDHRRQDHSHLTPPRLLLRLLDELALPKAAQKQFKPLRKTLRILPDQFVPPAVLQAVIEQLNTLLTPAGGQSPTGPLWQRLFGRPTPPAPPADDALDTARQVLDDIVAVLQEQVAWHEAISSEWQERVARTRHAQSLRQLAIELGETLNRCMRQHNSDEQIATPLPASPAGRDSEPPEQTDHAVALVLAQLVDRLDLPEQFTSRISALRDQLTNHWHELSWPAVLGDIADLVAAMRRQLQQEKVEVENFLSQLTSNLQEIDDNIRNSENLHHAAEASSSRLTDALDNQICGLETSVSEATDVDALKQHIQERLDRIRTHLARHKAEEELRNEQFHEYITTLTRRLETLEQEAEELRKRVNEQKNRALRDALTGIPNRLAYDERIDLEIARWKRFNKPLSLLVWDIDHFKNINDRYGHKAGDNLLKTIAQLIASNIRQTDFVARYGGEEFVVIMPGASAREALGAANKLRERIAGHQFQYRGEPVAVTASCGISEFTANSSAAKLFDQADRALYHAKQRGRNRCETAVSSG